MSNPFFKAIISCQGFPVKSPTAVDFTVLKFPQKGMHRRDAKFLEPSEKWLFDLDLSATTDMPSEGEIFTKGTANFLISGIQADSGDDTILAEVYQLPLVVNYYGLQLNADGDPDLDEFGNEQYLPKQTLFANEESILRDYDMWRGQTEDVEVYLIPPVAVEPKKGCKLSVGTGSREVTIDKVQRLRSSSGNLIGWRLKG